MKWICLLLLVCNLAFANKAEAPQYIKVAIVDTGLDLSDSRFKYVLCDDGHWNFVDNSNNPDDDNGHGTHVAGIIKKYAGLKNYCLMIIKYYKAEQSPKANREALINSFYQAVRYGANIVNYSGGGNGFLEEEYNIIANNPSIKFIVAAGNNNENLDCIVHQYFPACYRLKNVTAVGALQKDGIHKLQSSNYGKLVRIWEIGEDVISTLPGNQMGPMTGTSMAAPTYTGKLIKYYVNKSN